MTIEEFENDLLNAWYADGWHDEDFETKENFIEWIDEYLKSTPEPSERDFFNLLKEFAEDSWRLDDFWNMCQRERDEKFCKTINDINETRFFKEVTCLTDEEIKKKLKNHTITVFTVDDYIEYLKDSGCIDDFLFDAKCKDENELKKYLKKGTDSGKNGLDYGTWHDFDYVIEYIS